MLFGEIQAIQETTKQDNVVISGTWTSQHSSVSSSLETVLTFQPPPHLGCLEGGSVLLWSLAH